MKYIHYNCLKNWLNSKIESDFSSYNDISVITYSTKDICCELCKTKFPDYIRYKGKLFNITFYKPKFKEYIILESMRVDKHHIKYIHIISFVDKNVINIGRASDCDFLIQELSVSRFHCILHRYKGELYLEDNKSKFGSLILIQNNNLLMNDYLPLKLQINKTYLKLKMCLPVLFSCCNANIRELKKYDYQKQNEISLDVFSTFEIKDNADKLNIDEDDDENENEEILKNNEKKNKNKNSHKKVKKIIIKNKKSVEKIFDNNNNQYNNNEEIPLNALPELNKINLTPLENKNLELLALSGINNNNFSEINNLNILSATKNINYNTTNNPFAQNEDKNRADARVNIHNFFNRNLINNSNFNEQNSGIISPAFANKKETKNNDDNINKSDK